MQIIYNALLWFGMALAVVFTLLVLLTGKGDAMSGGQGVRTTFKGRATFEDLMSRVLLGLGVGFMAITFIINLISYHTK